MYKLPLGLCVLSLLTVVPAVADPVVTVPALPPNNAPASFADLSEKLSPAVVNISSTQKVVEQGPDAMPENMPDMPELPPGSPFEQFFKDFMGRQYGMDGQGNGGMGMPNNTPVTSLGSGFIIDAGKGLVVTNNHVIKDADEVRVTLSDNTVLDAEIVGKDEKTDLALLKIKNDGHKLTAVSFGNSDSMRVGDWVVAIGNPFGLGGTVTAGIISARKRDISAGPYDDFIQTDASINRGNSGGPMFNLKGEVIGINTAIYSPSGGSVGIGFAVPSNLAKPIIDQLAQYGKTRRGWIGVKIQTVTKDIADSLGLKGVKGALIASITPGGPAEDAKLKAGDVILEFNGQSLDGMRQLPRIVAETPIGKEVPVSVWRDGKIVAMDIKVGELEKAESDGKIETGSKKTTDPYGSKAVELDGLGVSVANISPTLRQTYNIPEDVKGIVVTKMASMSESLDKGLTAGDVILEINQTPVPDTAKAEQLVAEARKAGKESVLLLVDNQGQGDVRFVGLKFKKSDSKEPAKK